MNKLSCLVLCMAMVGALQLANSMPTADRLLFEEDGDTDDGMSELPAMPNDEQETMLLDPKLNVFSSFCHSSRDHVLAEIRQASREYAANAMVRMFQSAGDVASEGLLAQTEASQRLANQMKDPTAAIAEPKGDDQFEQAVVEGQQKIQADPTPIRTMLQGFYSTAKASKGRFMAAALQKWAALKETGTMRETVTNLINSACSRVADYELQLRDQFSDYKRELAALDAKYEPVQLEDVVCITSRRVLRANRLCAVFQVASGPVLTILALKNA